MAKGLLLGIEKKTIYQEYEKQLTLGDMIILIIRWSNGMQDGRRVY